MKIELTRKMAKFLGVGALVLAWATPTLATPIISNGGQTVVINAIDDMFDVVFLENTQTQDGDPLAGPLSATIWFQLKSFANDVGTFEVTINNANVSPQLGRVTGVGFGNVDPNVTSASTPTTDWAAAFNKNGLELCLTSGSGNNCVGGGGNGVGPGNTAVISLLVGFSQNSVLGDGLKFEAPEIRWQTVTGTQKTGLSAKLGGEITATDAGGGSQVPEPTTVLLFGSGLAGLGLWRWKTKK